MTTYKETFGKQIKQLSTDPTDAGAEGQVWYNTTSGTFKSIVASGAWSSGAPLGTGRYTSGSFGNQTAGVVVGGSASGTKISNVEHYNGTGFSSATAFPAAISSGSGAGTQTAGLIAGGNSPSRTNAAFEYNGSSWTAANNLPGVMDNLANCGTETQSNVIMAVGRTPASGNSGTTQSVTYDGTNFASGPATNTARMFNTVSGAGTGTAGLIIGGFIDPSPNAMTNCEEYNGSSWTNTGSLNVATGFATAFGTQTNAVTQVNSPNYEGSEQYNGSTWAALPNIGVTTPGGLYGSSAGATGDAGWISSISPTLNKTAEWNFTANTITPGAWASGGNLNQARRIQGNVGGKDAGLTFGGYTTSPNFLNASEEYDGTSWTEGNNLNTGRYGLRGFGIQTAAVAIGGQKSGTPTATTVYESYDGTSWTESGNMNVAREEPGGFGIQTAGVTCKGFNSDPLTRLTSTEEYNGSSWTSGNATSVAASSVGSAGTLTAGVVAGGSTPPGAKTTSTEEYDGTNWTTGGAMIIGLSNAAPSKNGTQGEWQVAGGRTAAGIIGNTFVYNGSSWATGPSIATARTEFDGGGTAGSHLICGGSTPAPAGVTTTEEFTGETTAVNVKTLTSS